MKTGRLIYFVLVALLCVAAGIAIVKFMPAADGAARLLIVVATTCAVIGVLIMLWLKWFKPESEETKDLFN